MVCYLSTAATARSLNLSWDCKMPPGLFSRGSRPVWLPPHGHRCMHRTPWKILSLGVVLSQGQRMLSSETHPNPSTALEAQWTRLPSNLSALASQQQFRPSKGLNSGCTAGRNKHPLVRNSGCNTYKLSSEKLTIIRPMVIWKSGSLRCLQ